VAAADETRKLDRGTAWVGVASGIAGMLDLVTTLACLWLWLSPAELGTATIAGATLPVIERLGSLGMKEALVRGAGGDRRSLSTMMWVAVAGSVVLLVAIALLSRPIGEAFEDSIVGSLVIGFAIKQLVGTMGIVPEALLRRDLAFARLSRVRLVGTFADACTKLVVAYLGAHGHPELKVWCFVLGPMVNGFVVTAGLQLAHPWRPDFVFDLGGAIHALKFGAQVSAGELFYFTYSNADYIVIGRVFGDAAVGAYRLAYELVLDVVRLISLITAEVAFPAFARLKDQEVRAAEATIESELTRDQIDSAASQPPAGTRSAAAALLVRFTRQNLIALTPVVVFLAVEADDLLAILYPPLGPAAATAARILCLVGALRVISFVLPPMLAGLGHAGDALVYQTLALIVLPSSFAIAASAFPDHGYVVVAWAWAAGYPVVFAVLLSRALDRCGVRGLAFGRSIAGILACGVIAAAVAIGAREVLPHEPHLRAAGTAVIVVACYLVALARIERITPRSVWRGLRGGGTSAEST
jgi:O-antigen/teichoic acid export membrane protein